MLLKAAWDSPTLELLPVKLCGLFVDSVLCLITRLVIPGQRSRRVAGSRCKGEACRLCSVGTLWAPASLGPCQHLLASLALPFASLMVWAVRRLPGRGPRWGAWAVVTTGSALGPVEGSSLGSVEGSREEPCPSDHTWGKGGGVEGRFRDPGFRG